MLKKISRHNRKESYSPALILFVSLLNFWLTLHFSNSIIVNERSNDPQSILALSLPSGVEALILLGLFFLASKKAKYDFSMATQRNLAFYAALCGGIATVLGYGIFENTFCKIISTGAFGLFYTVCIFAFVTRGKSFGFKKALHYLCLGAVIALLLQVIMHIGPLRGLLFGAYCITPSVITFLLFLYDARTKTNSENACSSLPQTTPSLKEMPARLFFTLCLAGAIDGFNFSIFFEVDQQVQSAFTQSNSLSFLLGALIVYGAIHFAQKNLYFALYKITLPIIAIGVFLGVISCAISQQALSACAQIVILSGSRAATMVLWLICIFVASYKKFSVTWICSGLFFGLFAGRSLGIITGETIFLYTNQGEFVIGSIQFLMLYATAAILSESNELDPSSNSSWQSASLSTAKANDEDLLKATLDTITENHGLTPREADVLEQLANGRTKKYIANKFSISENTAKTHIGKVYQKLGIHSQQELLDIVDDIKEKTVL